jgi:hypothetical protein
VPPATLLVSVKLVNDDGTIVQVRVWEVPSAVPGSAHAFKYSLFYGRPGERIVGYDNEAGKGDHRHHRGREEPYGFRGIDRLLADFEADVERERSGGE